MKRLLNTAIALLIGATAATAQTEVEQLNLTGNVVGKNEGTIYLQRYDNKSFVTIDSTVISAGKFKFTTAVPVPEIYGLSLEGSAINPFDSFIIFLDSNPIGVHFDPAHEFANTVVTGSKEQDLLRQLLTDRSTPVQEKLKANPSSLAALYYLYRYQSFRLSPEELRSNLKLIDPAFANTSYVAVLNELANTLEGVSVGNKAPGFVAYTQDGDTVGLNDYLGKSYLLIDFWASWCPPCRAENPHLKEVYGKYHTYGLEILGISLDKKVAPWLKAIEQDGLPWQQVYDPEAWAGDAVVNYGVRLIPANFLIDSNGVIVGKNLKGDDLEAKLKELLAL